MFAENLSPVISTACQIFDQTGAQSAMEQNGIKKGCDRDNLRDLFQILTITLLSLLLPLSFLILARLCIARHIVATAADPTLISSSSLLTSLFLCVDSTLLHSLLPLICVAALFRSFTVSTTISGQSLSVPISRAHLLAAWVLLCILQVAVGLGIEGSIAAGINGSGVGRETSFLSKAIFFLGLYETMIFWSTAVVKPVVDDTVFGFQREERWVERAAMAVSFGTLWWSRLREEVNSLVVMAELKRDLLMTVGVTDFIAWWLYYLLVTIGMVRAVKGLLWLGMIFFRRRRAETIPGDSRENEGKV